MIIIGAGMAGCIAGLTLPEAIIYEAGDKPENNHKAVLRFRSEEVSKVTGIPFKKVTVHKSIYSNNKHHSECNPRLANDYSNKVIGGIHDRSIWNLDTSERFIAPSDFHLQMINKLRRKIRFNHKIDNLAEFGTESIISTIPMPSLAKLINRDLSGVSFNFREIVSYRSDIDDCDVYQTIYFPDSYTSLYRVSITGNSLIVESTGVLNNFDIDILNDAFGLKCNIDEFDKQSHRYGKISEINEAIRKSFIYEASRNFHVYSLGRFATWKNILLDDVVDDMNIINRIMTQSPYDLTRGVK